MLEINIPGRDMLCLTHLLLDYNGTLAIDGELLPGTAERLTALSLHMRVQVLTADTFGQAAARLSGIPCALEILAPGNQAAAKRAYLEKVGAGGTAAIGNGRNDRLMLAAAALGIAVVQGEGAAPETLMAAAIVAPDICAALDLLLHPRRLVATLRD
jgi:soluble P-type ATPase